MGALSTISSSFLSALLLVCLVCSFNSEGAAAIQHRHTIHVSSLLPSSICQSSAQELDKKSSLRVVHKHGPCSELHQDKANIPTHAEILLQDEARVKSIHSKFANKGSINDIDQNDAANLPAKDGSVVGSGNYIVSVGLGTPKKDLNLIFDTGRNSPGCSSSACVYGIQYGDSSFSVGFFAKDTLSLTSTDLFPDFLFGCGQNNQGLFGGAAGLLGLGRDKLSLPSQTAAKYYKYFSYCLPSSASSTGFLSFGYGGGVSKTVKFTPLSTISQGTSFYGIDITGVTVGGQKLPISASVFSAGGAIIDSGTVITRLPPTAYDALKTAFRKQMSQYPMAQPLSILDTCYDFSRYSTVTIPKISFFLSGSVVVPIDAKGIFYVNSISQVCLAFAPNGDDTDVGIFGNTQQKTLQVVYDGAKGRLGFASGGCS
ncbi:Peptidase A1 [Corchorus capsularis]|uniref:Peptidase A1 n=1 Tax=Corchorus capsularis TaxID=210143 RepID=A0A1R3GTY7_COCAP|nr:Peptidase A1 [Corchorus capsularis]